MNEVIATNVVNDFIASKLPSYAEFAKTQKDKYMPSYTLLKKHCTKETLALLTEYVNKELPIIKRKHHIAVANMIVNEYLETEGMIFSEFIVKRQNDIREDIYYTDAALKYCDIQLYDAVKEKEASLRQEKVIATINRYDKLILEYLQAPVMSLREFIELKNQGIDEQLFISEEAFLKHCTKDNAQLYKKVIQEMKDKIKLENQRNVDKELLQFMASGYGNYIDYKLSINASIIPDRPQFQGLLGKCSKDVKETYNKYKSIKYNELTTNLLIFNQRLIDGEKVDIIDYFDQLQIDPITLFVYLRKNKFDKNILPFKKFIKKYIITNWNYISTNFLNKPFINYDLDRPITEIEKRDIYQYMINNRYPLYIELFIGIANRYLKGTLDLASTDKGVKNDYVREYKINN